MNVMTELKPLCYSYVRFSTPDQIKGDSKRRQIDKARAWALEHGYEFDESLTIRDEGKSAYKGAHIYGGNLGKFLERCKDGDIPKGSVLYVEAIDRLTRLNYWDAQDLISDLLKHVDLVVSQISNEVITRKGGSTIAYSFAGLIIGSNAESQRKSGNQRESWKTKRIKSSENGCLYTEIVPEWISVEPYVKRRLRKDEKVMDRFTRDKTKSEKVIVGVMPERGKIIKAIFRKYNKGVTMGAIATSLNAEGVETWRKGNQWHRSYIRKILSNPSVCGTLQQYRTESVDDIELGERQKRILENEVHDYYPKVISSDLFKSVQAKLPQKGKSGGSRATQNALSNLCECPKCGSTITRVNKGEKSGAIPKLVCTSRHKLGRCDHERFNQHEVELSMMRFFDRWDFEQGLDSLINAKPKEREQLVKKIKEINEALEKANKLPYSTHKYDFVLKLLDEKRKLELSHNYSIDISAKRFNESIAKFKSATTPSEQNANLRQIINKIIIHKVDDLEVSFIGCEKKFRIGGLLKNPRAREKLSLNRRKKALKPA
jgi:DNA invertase Pin-like site-specific DNA recombinase